MFGAIDKIIGGDGINGDRDRIQIEFDLVVNRHRVCPGILRTGIHHHLACGPALQIRSRYPNLPVTATINDRMVSHVIDSHVDRRTCRQMAAAPGDHQILMLFDGVNNVVAREGIDTQARQRRVDVDIAIAGTGVAVAVRYRSGKGQITIAKAVQVARRNGYFPAQIIFYGGGIMLAAHHDGNRVACGGICHATA